MRVSTRKALADLKEVVYYCPGCRQRIVRHLPRSQARYESYCATAGRLISMRRIKDQKKALMGTAIGHRR